MIYCIQNIDSFSYTDPTEKRAKIIGVTVPSFVDAFQGQAGFGMGPGAKGQIQKAVAMNSSWNFGGQGNSNLASSQIPGLGQNTLDYKNYGSYTKDLKKRDFKFDEKQAAKRGLHADMNEAGAGKAAAAANGNMSHLGLPRARGRKPIYIK